MKYLALLLSLVLAVSCAGPTPIPSPTVYGKASDGTPLTWEVAMPSGKTKAPWILTIESAHWVIDSGVPAQVTNAITNAGYAAVHPLHRLAPPGKIAGQKGN